MDGLDRARIFPLRSKLDTPAGGPGSRDTLPNRAVLQNRYEILRVVGRGGMGAVYCARDRRFTSTLRLCAIKEMIDKAKDAQERLQGLGNFEREANLLASLNHPAVPKIFDYFSEDNRNYLVMEFIEGHNLEAVLEQTNGFLSEDQVIEWGLQLCDVLAYLHAQRPNPVIFRDLKPSNIMLLPNDRIMLVDFGIAKVFQENKKGTMIGTEGYSAPEQYRGIYEPRTDIYALGATLHQLLTKSDPRLETPFTFFQRPVRQINPNVSKSLEAVVMKMVEYEVEKRYSSAEAAGEALFAVSRGSGGGSIASSETGPMVSVRTGRIAERLIWQHACQDEVRSSPRVAHGLVFIGSYDHSLYAFDAGSGELAWVYQTKGGIASSPFVHKERVYVGSEDSSIYALRAKTGEQVWSFITGGPVRSSPRGANDVIYCGSDDHQLYALDADWGRLVWRFSAWRPVRSSPAIEKDLVYCGSEDEFVYALRVADGTLKWKFRTMAGVLSSPAISEKLLIVGSADCSLYGLDAESGFVIWRLPTGGQVSSSPCVASGKVFVGSADKHVYAVDASTGQMSWQYQTDGPVTSSPRFYRGAVYVGSGDGCVYSIDAETGKARWKFKTDGPVPASPAISDGILYIGSTDRHVYALRA